MTPHRDLQLLDLEVARFPAEWRRARRQGLSECLTVARRMLSLLTRLVFLGRCEMSELTIAYTNHRGERAVRRIIPWDVWFGTTDWHPEPQWFLRAFDLDKNDKRDFALKDFGPVEKIALSTLREPSDD